MSAVDLARAAVDIETTVEILCPVCDVPLTQHHVTRWYSRRYDVWSDKLVAEGMTCFVVDWRRLPDEAALLARQRAARGRRTGAKEGVDFHDPTLKRRASEQTAAWRKAGRPKRRKRR